MYIYNQYVYNVIMYIDYIIIFVRVQREVPPLRSSEAWQEI